MHTQKKKEFCSYMKSMHNLETNIIHIVLFFVGWGTIVILIWWLQKQKLRFRMLYNLLFIPHLLFVGIFLSIL